MHIAIPKIIKRVRSARSLLLALSLIFGSGGNSFAVVARYAIKGTIVSARGVIENGTMLVASGRILAIGADISVPEGAPVVQTDGVIFPGLIDIHNHLVWNVLPRWKLKKPVANRYEWQALPDYAARLSGPQASLIGDGKGCMMQQYAEVKALLGGATSVIGSYGPSVDEPNRNECVKGLARNLDVFSGLFSTRLNAEPVRYDTFPLEIPWEQASAARDGLGSRSIRAMIVHLGEGKDEAAKREFRMFRARGLLRPGVSIIHGIAFGESEFREMASNGVGFVWSPRSNMELYGSTADLVAAKAAGVTIALAPDWSPTGSSGMLAELRFAKKWNEDNGNLFTSAELFQMVTRAPARLAGLSDKIGALSPGMVADLIVLPRKAGTVYETLFASGSSDLRLVVVGGAPILGTPKLMQDLGVFPQPEELRVCGKQIAINFPTNQDIPSWTALHQLLETAVAKHGTILSELAECQSP